MASLVTFFENLWESIFTPGPTPTLLVATNASFAALQLLLFALLLATHSVHFVILSTLTAGLWWAINWFAGEIRAAQAKEEAAQRIRETRREKEKGKGGEGDDVEAMDSGDDTEVETEVEEKTKKTKTKPALRANPPRTQRPEMQSTVFVERPEEGRGSTPVPTSTGLAAAAAAASTTGASTRLAPMADEAVKRRKSMGESTGELSTDSEWEKLSQDSGDR